MNLPTLEPQIPTVCRLLRTKTAFGAYSGVDDLPWQSGESTTAVFWCLATMQTAGPDEHFAHPHECQAGRQCFKPPEE